MAFKFVREKKIKGYEKVVFGKVGPKRLTAIIAIHNTNLGPALGGTRMFPYKSEKAALKDVLRLSRGMTYKAAVAGLELGGGKAVIIGDPGTDKSKEMWHDFGDFVQSLNGQYITAEDVGTSVEDMEYVYQKTKYATGKSSKKGGNGDPSPVTAHGVIFGIRASLKTVFGDGKIAGRKFAVQGLGKVGFPLAKLLAEKRAIIYVADPVKERVKQAEKKLGAIPVDVDEILFADVDVVCPCALGAIINDETISKIKAKIIAGSANNQLADEKRDGRMLEKKGIFYAPDYAINSGGLICVAGEVLGYNKAKSFKRSEKVFQTILKTAEIARKRKISTAQAANELAEERIGGS